jgi:hypothetical protein
MARRRKKSSRAWVLPLVLLGVAAFAAWRYGPEAWRTFGPDSTVKQTPAAGPLDVCALVDAKALGAAIHAESPAPRHVGAAADVPAAGACTWTFGRDGRVVALVFTRDSLARSKQPELVGERYFKSVVAGLEYAYHEPPVALTGIGDEAAAAGFGAGAAQAQIVARRGDVVLDLSVSGVERAGAERAAALIAARL